MSRFQDAVSPWSFFIPFALAVMVGVLAADLVRNAVPSLFGPRRATVAEPAAAGRLDSARPSMRRQSAPVQPVADPQASGPQAAPEPQTQVSAPPQQNEASFAQAVEEAPAASEPESGRQELSGPFRARREGESEACINGTVVFRSGNGWEQRLENDAPIACTPASD